MKLNSIRDSTRGMADNNSEWGEVELDRLNRLPLDFQEPNGVKGRKKEMADVAIFEKGAMGNGSTMKSGGKVVWPPEEELEEEYVGVHRLLPPA